MPAPRFFPRATVARARLPSTTVCAVALGLVGCGDDAAVRPGDIRSYTAPRTTAPPIASAARVEGGAERPSATRLRYDLPDGWVDGSGPSGMRLATVTIGDPAEGREVTVIPASGSLRNNVERWQKQLAGNDAASVADAVDRALTDAETVDVDGTEATVVLLVAAPAADGEAILGAMVPLDDTSSLFVKFKGKADVALRERSNFTRFVSSLRWN